MNSERQKQYQREWVRDWRARNRERDLARRRELRSQNRDRILEQKREWRRKNADRLRAENLEKMMVLRECPPETPRECNRCGRSYVRTPRQIAEGRTVCARCLGLKSRAANQRAMQAKYPDKYRARTLVARAIRSGALVKKPCEVCGVLDAEAHHEDYTKPLEVQWLCRPHHSDADRALESASLRATA